MTLIITALSMEAIYQAADFRLTDARSGKLITDNSTKLTVLQFENWHGFIAYTGVGACGRTSTSTYLRQWLTGLDAATPAIVSERIRVEGSRWLREIARRSGEQAHTFVLGAFERGTPSITLISNFERLGVHGHHRSGTALEVSQARAGARPIVIVCGAKRAVDRTTRRQVEHACQNASNPAAVRRLLSRVVSRASKTPAAAGTVSNDCSVVSFRADGTGFLDQDGNVEVQSISRGIPRPTAKELAKLVGAKSFGKLVGAAFSRGGPKQEYPPCVPRIIRPEGAQHRLFEASGAKFQSSRAFDINDTGLILGSAEIAGQETRAWLLRPDSTMAITPFRCGYGGMNNNGVVAGSTTTSDGLPRAILWAGDENAFILSFREGSGSQAVAISDPGIAVGWVGINPADHTQKSNRPAAWRGDESAVLDDLPCDWGEAVDVNEAGWVVVVGHVGFEARTYLWNPAARLGHWIDGYAGVFPAAINHEGTVIGNGLNEQSEHVALTASVDGVWQPIFPDPGYHVCGLNDCGDMVGTVREDGLQKPWLRTSSGQLLRLPYIGEHFCSPIAINNDGTIVGMATADHGTHALVWKPAAS